MDPTQQSLQDALYIEVDLAYLMQLKAIVN